MADKITMKPVSATEVAAKMAIANAAPVVQEPVTPIVEAKVEDKKVVADEVKKVVEETSATTTTPEVKLDDKGNPIAEPVVENKRKKIRETSKPFFKAPEKIVEQGEVPDNVKTKYSEYEKQIADYRKIADDPDVQIILEAKKSGKDIFGILKEVQGIDPSTYSLEQLHEIDLKNQGIEGVDFDEAMDDFRALKPYQQKSLTNPIKNKLESDINSKKESFLSKLKEGTQENSVEQQKQVAALTKTQQDFNKLCDDYVGQEHYSVVGTLDMVKSLKNLLADPNGLIPKNEDGSLNAQVLFDLAHYRLFGDLRLENLENQYFAEGVEAIEKKVEARGDAGKIIHMPTGTPTQNVDVGRATFSTLRPAVR